jgi:hypothetical protein
MASVERNVGPAPFCMMITFEVAPEDEAQFNDVYDNEHVPNILEVDGVLEVVRFTSSRGRTSMKRMNGRRSRRSAAGRRKSAPN